MPPYEKQGGNEDEEIHVGSALVPAAPTDIVPAMPTDLVVVDDHDPTIDPLQSGFLWYKPPPTLSSEHALGRGHRWAISGHDMQVLTTTVPPGDELITEVGSFLYMHPSMKNEVECTLCDSSGEGCSRILGGESCVKVHLKNESADEGYAGVTPNYPAKIIPVRFGSGGGSDDVQQPGSSGLIAQGGAIMSQIGDVDVGCSVDCSPATCCCAGLGCFRQRIGAAEEGGGQGVAFLAAGGTLVTKQLDEGETIVVDGNSVVAFEETIELGVAFSGRCCMCFLGGEGCFNTTLTGPGKVYMQSMSFRKYKAAVQQVVYEQMERGDDGDGGDN